MRIRAAHGDRSREEEWLLIEWPTEDTEPTRYWFSTLPEETTFEDLVATVKVGFRIERDYLELKAGSRTRPFRGAQLAGLS